MTQQQAIESQERLECLDRHQGNCRGEVEMFTLDGIKWWPRCERHFDARVKRYEGSMERYANSASAPSWFDPGYAGESWDEP